MMFLLMLIIREFIGQNIHNIFDDRFSRIESHLGMKPIGSDNNAYIFNTDKTMGDSAGDKILIMLL